jgi:hypothetical protein
MGTVLDNGRQPLVVQVDDGHLFVAMEATGGHLLRILTNNGKLRVLAKVLNEYAQVPVPDDGVHTYLYL